MGLIGAGAGTITKGQRGQSAIGASRKVPQYIDMFQDISVDTAPLLALMENFGFTKKVKAPTYFHLETDKLPEYVTINNGGGYASGATSIVVSSASNVQAGNVLFCERTQEMIYVTAVATNTLTVTRGAGSTTAAAINDTEEIRILGFADSDGNTAPSGTSSEPTLKTNATQIMKVAWEASRRDIEQEVYGPDEWSRIMGQKQEELDRYKEQTYLFQNGISTTGTTLTGGFQYWVTTNVSNAAGALDEGSWNTWLRGWLRRNTGQKNLAVFAGELVQAALAGFGRDAIRYGPDDNLLGITCGSYRAENGMVVKIVPHGMLTPINSGVTAANRGAQGYAFGVNFGKVGEVTFSKRKHEKNVQLPGTDGKKDQLIEDVGLALVSEQHHAIYYGVTG